MTKRKTENHESINLVIDQKELDALIEEQKVMAEAWDKINVDELNTLADEVFTQNNDPDGSKMKRLEEIFDNWSKEVDEKSKDIPNLPQDDSHFDAKDFLDLFGELK
jgi:tRNA A37 N6-isopentenylltransferase MiaA